MNRSRRRTAKQRNGAVVVEMALTLPILLLILFAAYEFGRANMLRHAASAAAYEGARVGIIPGATSQDVIDATEFVLSSVGTKNASITVEPANITSETSQVKVTVNLSMRDNTFFGRIFTEEVEFEGICELKREGF